ncbi:unnamed protein product [Prorocentrum cordatum]|uniref:Uncharacterized protein n=1 Tax=Prorocentrum cordatum TaxID=2364126 RepID=A0ABN9T5D9_9DINO|nr:unnamed protein product [Polarella glacialis]
MALPADDVVQLPPGQPGRIAGPEEGAAEPAAAASVSPPPGAGGQRGGQRGGQPEGGVCDEAELRRLALEEAKGVLPNEIRMILSTSEQTMLEVMEMCQDAPGEQLEERLANSLVDLLWAPLAGCVPQLPGLAEADVRMKVALFWRCAAALCAMPLAQLAAMTRRKRPFLRDLDPHVPPASSAPARERLAHVRLNLPIFAMVAKMPSELGKAAEEQPKADTLAGASAAPATTSTEDGVLLEELPRERPAPRAAPADAAADKSKTAARHTYDVGYKKWDKFDVDEALREADDPPSDAPRVQVRFPGEAGADAAPPRTSDDPVEMLEGAMQADELKIYKSKAQSKLQKFANLLVAVRDAGKEDPALEFDIGVLKYMMSACKGSEKQLHELKAQLISAKERLGNIRAKVEELLDEEATLCLMVQKLQNSIQQLREAEATEPDGPRAAWHSGLRTEGQEGRTAAAITAMTEQMRAVQAQQQAIQEHLSRMQTGQNFHAFALARVLGVGIGAAAGDVLMDAQTIQKAQRAVISGLSIPSASPPDLQGLAPERTQRDVASTAPGYGAAPPGAAPATGPRAPTQRRASSLEPPVAKTPPPKRQSASPKPARAPCMGVSAETRAQAEEKAVPDTPRVKGVSRVTAELQRNEPKEEVLPIDPELLIATQPMVMEEMIPGPVHILQHIQGASIDLISQTQRSPTPPPAQRNIFSCLVLANYSMLRMRCEDTRHLVVGCCAPLFRKVILVAHALHSGDEYTSQQRKEWWRDLIGICHTWKVQLAFLDANARLGSIVSEAVGSEGFRQDEDESGGLFHDMLLETGLVAANTLVPSLSQDHYPVFMRFESQGSTKAAQQQSGYDARGTQGPDKAAAFRMHLAAFPTVPHQAFAEWDKQILAASELAAHMLEFLVKSKPALRRALKLSRNKLLDDLAQQLCNARSTLLKATMNMLSVVQQGALPQRGTDIASLRLRSAMMAAEARERTYLSLYTDLKAAFYSVIRGLVARMAQNSEDIQNTLAGLEIPSCLEPLCHALVAKPGALDGLGSKHLLEAVVDVM